MAAQKSNLYFGTGLINDMNEVKIGRQSIDGSQNGNYEIYKLGKLRN